MNHLVFRTFLTVAAALMAGVCLARPPAGLEVVAEFDLDTPPGNVAVTPSGRVFMSLHAFYGPTYRVVEVLPDGGTKPFPNEAWATAPGADGIGLNAVLGLRADRDGIVWMLDNAGEGQGAKILAWDTEADRLHRLVYIDAPFRPANAFLNDLAVDRTHEAIYVTDTTGVVDGSTNQALLVIDLATGQVRRVLEGHVSNLAEDVDVKPEGRVIAMEGTPARVGSDSITIDTKDEWLYYGPLSGTKLYRVRTSDLRNAALSAEALADRVEVYADKPVSDGLTMDGAGNIYVTDVNAASIGVIDKDRRYRILFQDDRYVSWPDGFAFAPDNHIYVTVNQLHRSPAMRGDGPEPEAPLYLVRFKSLAPGSAGR